MLLQNYKPRPALVTKATAIAQPRFPVIDSHNHLRSGGVDRLAPAEVCSLLDESNIRVFVDLDGGWGEEILYDHLDRFKNAAPERFVMFAGVDWARWPEMGGGFVGWAVERLRVQAQRGAQGLKIWKNFGLEFKDPAGQRIAVDDSRLDPIWEAAAGLRLPVLIHVADPVAFFDPVNETNERWEELQAHPSWRFTSPPFPPFLQILNELSNMVARHPATTFIGAHVGCYAENLGYVADLLERCPNFNVDISARVGELGRQPYAARRFFLQHADRIVFGLDEKPAPSHYQPYFRFLETDDEYFPYGPGEIPHQGRWNIYGIHLPDDVLEKVYYRNAERILFGR